MPLDFDSLYRSVSAFDDAGHEFERIVRRVYEAVLQPGDAAVDVGAHVGKHTLPMALACGESGSVLAIEPIPWAYDQLAGRVEASGLGGVVRTIHACCADDVGDVTFSVVPSHPGWSSLVPRSVVQEVEEVAVHQTTLDTECLPGPRIRFVKVDVEGAEQLVLDGARQVLARDRPVLHLEVVASALLAFSTPAALVGRSLRQLGYQVLDILGNDVTDEAAWEASVGAAGLSDYIAVRPDDPARDRVLQVLRSSFTAERREGSHAGSGFDLLPPPYDGLDPVLPEIPLRWRQDAAVHRARAVVPTPVSASTPVPGLALRLRLELTGVVPRGVQTLVELHWTDVGLTTLVRYVRGDDLQVVWLDEAGAVLTSAASTNGLAGELVDVVVSCAGSAINVSATSEWSRADASRPLAELGSGQFDGLLGARRHHPNPERLHVAEMVVSTSVTAAPLPTRGVPGHRLRTALRRVRHVLGQGA